MRKRLYCMSERAVLYNQEFAEITAKSANHNLCAINADTLHEPLEQPNLTAQLFAQVRFDVVGVVRCSVSCALPLTQFSIITRYNVHSVVVNEDFNVRMLSKTFNLLCVASCFFSNFQT